MTTKTRVGEREAVQLLLVKAVEQGEPAAFDGEVLARSVLAAQQAKSDAELLKKRAAVLFFHLPKSLKHLDRIALLPENWLGFPLLLSFLVGIASNYLGSAGQIHVIYNPIILLLVWNLAVYAMLLWWGVLKANAFWAPDDQTSSKEENATRVDGSRKTSAVVLQGYSPFPRGVRYLLPGLWAAWNRWYVTFQAKRAGLKNAADVVGDFLESYFSVARPVFVPKLKLFFHLSAIGLTMGAVTGTYLRGLFFEYRAVWRSTFITDPAAVRAILNTLFLPASLILGGAPISLESVGQLLEPTGEAAAPWLHLMVLSAFLFVCVPRVILASLAAKRAKLAANRIEINLADPYFLETICRVRESHLDRIREEASIEIRVEIAKLAESLGVCIRDRFFDCHVLPTMIAFRNAGGRIADLEMELQRQAASFQPELLQYLSLANLNFQNTLEERLRKIVGRRVLGRHLTVEEASIAKPEALGLALAGSVARGFTESIGVGVAAAVSAGMGTISGGIGKSLGIAILSSLLGTSGPIGLMLGALVGLAAGGAAYWLGKDRLTSAVKQWKIPAGFLKLALRDSRLQETRDKVYQTVRKEVQDKLEPATSEITNQLLTALSANLGPASEKEQTK